MTISLPDTFTIDQSEKYILSIRLRSGGLSFSGYSPLRAESYFFRSIDFDRSTPFITSLQEFFFTNEFLSWTYKRTNLVFESDSYALVPQLFFEESKKKELLSFSYLSSTEYCLSNTLRGQQATLLFGVEEQVYEFCARSLLDPYVYHSQTPLISLWERAGVLEEHARMYAIVHQETVDIACFHKGKLLFMNCFPHSQESDLLYYILYIWQQQSMDQLHDILYVWNGGDKHQHLTDTLRMYLNHVNLVEIPSEAYLTGGEILKAPIDMIALTVCEL